MVDSLPPGCTMHQNPVRGDERGKLVALEGGTSVPFDIARIYYLFDNVPNTERGFHAHRALQQWVICVAGSCKITLDDGTTRGSVMLNSAEIGLHIRPMIWREINDFSPGTVLLVLADAVYDEADYIRDHAEFLKIACA
ncbi:sugar 3,4-ketoisomerase [Sphingomonas sp. Leaf28]|uniref:sugar 3,4-ketoisomerase n=1 Tax=Sphingomonas sp. Leaf28 TaxID=1735695 RepID=UPI000B0783E0|nr:FdtA/QdtA family cupin domain-containing protein [Sphingomonas sp. Leaf28]